MSYLSIVWGLLGGYFFFKEVSHRLARLLLKEHLGRHLVPALAAVVTSCCACHFYPVQLLICFCDCAFVDTLEAGELPA